MRTKVIKIILIMLVTLGLGTIASNAAISGNSQTINSGENVTITITSNKKLSSYKISVTNDGGLSYISCADSNGGQSGNKMIAGSPSDGTTKLGTFTFKAPAVTTDAEYTVKFSATAMETPDLEEIEDSSTSVKITVKAPETNNNNSNENNNSSSENNNNGQTSSENNNNDQTSNNNGTTTNKPVEKSSNNKLSNLGIRPNDFSGFKSGTTKYNVTVPNNVSEVEVYAKVPQDSKATVSGTGKMKLDVGSNQAKVVCTAENGTTRTYVINITRKTEEEEKPTQEPEEQDPEETTNLEEQQPEENNEQQEQQITIGLAKLDVMGKNEKGENVEVELTPSFDENQQEYLLVVPLNVIEVDVNAQAISGEAEVEVMGNKDLVEGENIITVIVKIGENTKVYQITVNKVAVSSGSALSQDIIIQLAIIAAIITIVIVAIVVIIIMIVRNSKKDKTITDISNEILPEDNDNNKTE